MRDENRRNSLVHWQKLYEAAKAVTDGPQDFSYCPSQDALRKLQHAVVEVDNAAAESSQLDHVRDKAAELYCDSTNDIEVDDCNTYHNGTDGYWVQGWLWVSGPDVGEEEPDDEEGDE